MERNTQSPFEQNTGFTQPPRRGRFDVLVKGLAVIGLIVILGFTGWGFVKVAQLAPGAFSNLAAGIVSITSQFFPAEENDTATTTPEADTATTTDDSDTEQNAQNNGTSGNITPVAGAETREDANDAQLRRVSGGTASTRGTDLEARIIEIGIVDPETETFIATTTIHRSDQVAVRFAVENVGSGVSKQWSFNAVLPTTPAHIYDSNTQRELNPGDRIEYTIGFDRLGTEPKYFVLNIDPRGTLNDANSENNIARVEISPSDK